MWPLRRQKHLCGETGKSCSKKENTTLLRKIVPCPRQTLPWLGF
jgi:hypothetical protein